MNTQTKKIASYNPQSNQTRATGACSRFDRPDAPPLGKRRVLTQACRDLYGTKDVQDVITASYVWLADQLGHITLGLLPTLLLAWAWTGALDHWWPQASNTIRISGLIVLAALVFGYWIYKELTDYADTKARAGKVFFFDSADLTWNVKTALFYFGVGGALATSAFIGVFCIVITLLVALYPMLRIGYWWLRRKLAFQQAGLPFLYRLANFPTDLDDYEKNAITELSNLKNRRVDFWKVLLGIDSIKANNPRHRHLLIAGELGAGKSSLVVGIGTEFAFALGIGRYLTATKLVQLLVKGVDQSSTMEFKDGRVLWPLRQCDLIVVDDVDSGVYMTHQLNSPENLTKAVGDSDSSALQWIGERRSVWVIGDTSQAAGWQQAISRLIGVDPDEILIVKLSQQRIVF